MTDASSREDLGFDPEALLARYREERDKRLREDTLEQYVQITGDYAHFRDDPYVETPLEREPLQDEVEVLIIGGGFGGLLLGARLREAGVEDLRIVERGADVGGTWYWNRYPGAACDVESYIYLPLLEEMGVMPTRKYAPGSEILEHCRAIARRFDLYRNACLQTEVTGLRWDDVAGRWVVSTNRGDAIRAQFVVLAPGPLDRPKLPGIPGIETFEGHAFHTSRWDYDYTGSAESGLSGLADKVVGVIGTGATAVQCIPPLGAGAQQLLVFQRTPSTINVRDDRPTDPDWAAALEPGWQQHRMENFTRITTAGSDEEDLVRDGWTEVTANVQFVLLRLMGRGEPVDDPARVMQLADLRKMEDVRRRVDTTVEDRATAEALKPWYNHFCKRPCFHDEFLPTFNRPNVRLVDTQGRGVERITPRGVVVDGVEHPVDCLVYATGFEVVPQLTRRMGFEVHGRDGLPLSERWGEGAATLHGITTRGFPNLFIVSHIQSGFSYNFPHMLGEQARHIAYVLAQARARGAQRVEVSEQAEQAWVDEVLRTAPQREAFARECTPSYFNYEGSISRLNARNSPYGGGAMAFVEALRAWRAEGDLPGLELS